VLETEGLSSVARELHRIGDEVYFATFIISLSTLAVVVSLGAIILTIKGNRT
jgi:hypothetical protein